MNRLFISIFILQFTFILNAQNNSSDSTQLVQSISEQNNSSDSTKLSSDSIQLVQNINAQNKSADSTRLVQAIDWLEKHLTYNYYNADDSEWWINRFTYNEANRSVTIKNISSPQIQSVTDKSYLQLDLNLEDLNPYTITIEKRSKNDGRLVTGKTIRVGAYHYDKSIKRTKNGRLSTSQSFMYISIPTNMEDSLGQFADKIANQLKIAIELSSKIYATGDAKSDLAVIRKVVSDRYKSGEQYWLIHPLFSQTYEIEILDASFNQIEHRVMRLINEGDTLEMVIFRPNEATVTWKLPANGFNKYLYEADGSSIHFVSLNSFMVKSNGQEQEFIRDWTYDSSPAKYR